MRLDLRWLGVKQKLRVRQTQPLLRIVAQISGEIGGVFGGNHFYEYSRFYRMLQAHCKAEQLGSVEQFANEDRVENSGEIRWIARDKPQRAVTIQSLKTIGQLTFYFKVRFHPETHQHQFINFIGCSNGQRRGSHTSDGKIRFARGSLARGGRPLPNWQAANEALLKSFIIRDCTNDIVADNIRQPTAGLDKIKLSGLSGFVRRERTCDTQCIPRQVQS